VTKRLCCALCALLSVSVALSSSAFASGIVAPRVGNFESVTGDTATSMHLNPALLTTLPGGRFQLDVAAINAWIGFARQRRATYQHSDGFTFKQPLAATDVDASKTGPAAPLNAQTSAPSVALSFALPIGNTFAIGVAAVPEYAAVLNLPNNGPHKWHVQQTFVFVEYVSLAAAANIGSRLHIGASLDIVLGTMSLAQSVDLAGTELLGGAFADPPINQPNDFGEDAPPGVRELDVLSRDAMIHEATGTGLTFKVGALFEATDSLRLAATFQKGIDLIFVGDFYMDMDHPFWTTDLASQGLKYPRQVKGKAFVSFPMPSVLRGGFAWDVTDSLTVNLQASYLFYSVVDSLTVTIESDDFAQPELGLGRVNRINLQRKWIDSLELETLTDVQVTDDLGIGVRLGYHSPVSPDRYMDLIALDGHRLIGGVGGRLAFGDALTLTAHATVQHMLSRTVLASDNDRGNGTYDLTILIAGAGFQYGF